jgi:hypothetical protein
VGFVKDNVAAGGGFIATVAVFDVGQPLEVPLTV